MTSTTADTVPVARATRTDSGTDTTTRTRRSRASSEEESDGNARYFLAKTTALTARQRWIVRWRTRAKRWSKGCALE